MTRMSVEYYTNKLNYINNKLMYLQHKLKYTKMEDKDFKILNDLVDKNVENHKRIVEKLKSLITE